MSYLSLLSFGDIIPLNIICNPSKLLKEVKQFQYHQYNPRKDIPRYGMSITSLHGELDGIDLDSIIEYNKDNNTEYHELSFKELTEVYYSSDEIQKVVDPFKQFLGRSHILYLPRGGYFPPHRDLPVYAEEQNSLRILIPLQSCNPPDLYFMYENKPVYFEHGRAYFMNTNKQHCLFAMKDSYMIVLNIATGEQTYEVIGKYFQSR